MKKISVLNGNKIETAKIEYTEHPAELKITLENGWANNFKGQDIYDCLGNAIKNLPHINFLCKGAKLNVRPSSMSSQMTSGVMAYEHTLGKRVKRVNLVNIFDFDDLNIINDPQLQTDYFFRWLESLKQVSR